MKYEAGSWLIEGVSQTKKEKKKELSIHRSAAEKWMSLFTVNESIRGTSFTRTMRHHE